MLQEVVGTAQLWFTREGCSTAAVHLRQQIARHGMA
jgi:hypothetical protein